MVYLRILNLQSHQSLEFESTQVRLGRSPDCELAIEGEGSEVVSGNHARFVEKGGSWYLEDLGSRNGTFLGEERVAPESPRAIAVESVIRLGTRGPRFKVEAVQKRAIADTLSEDPPPARPSAATMPMSAVGLPVQPEPPPIEEVSVSPPAPTPKPPPPSAKPEAKPEPKVEDVLRLSMFETRTGEHYKVGGGRIRIGRGKECELRPVGPDDTSVSRVHAEIVLTPQGKVVVRDAQSRNGTYVDGVLLSGEKVLEAGIKVRLGPDGPELLIRDITLPGAAVSAKASAQPSKESKPPAKVEEAKAKEKNKEAGPSAAERAAAKLGGPRRSFGGKGATMFFNEMFQETSRKSAKRARIAIWSAVAIVVVAVAAAYWYQDRLGRQLEERLAAQQAMADSVSNAASAEYERLRQELDAARASSAPAAVVDSLREALGVAEARTTALEEALARAQRSLQEQLAAGDSIRRAAQNEWNRLQNELQRASASGGTSGALLDSLRQAVQAAEDRATQIASQVRAVRGGNLAAVAQANQAAVGLVTSYVGSDLFDGSGFALTATGYFVTNRHVVQPSGHPRADSVFVTLADQKNMRRARVVVVAPPGSPDLAVLQVLNHDGSHVAKVDWDGQNAHQGEPAALIGFPAGYGNALDETGTVRTTMTAGIFAKVTPEAINFDGFTIGGSSGSPIFNANGEVVGVHRAGLSEAVGMGFAVPITALRPFLPDEVRRELGFQ